MKRLIIALSIAAAAAGAALAEGVSVTAAAPRRGVPEAVMKKTGGIVEKQGEGKVVVVNCQDVVGEALVAERAARLEKLLKCAFEVRRGTWDVAAQKPRDANFAIFLVDAPGLPMSLVAAESGWGMVNTSGLAEGGRFSKQLTRVFALTVGAMCSRNIHSPMQPVSSVEQLDGVKSDDIMRDMIDSIRLNMKARGMTPARISSYRKACEEGWAPAPTNEYQKAIWDKVHVMPTEPIKIKPETKKVQQ